MMVNLTTAVGNAASLLYVKDSHTEIYHSWRAVFIGYMGDGSSTNGLAFFYHQYGVTYSGQILGISGLPGHAIKFDTYKNNPSEPYPVPITLQVNRTQY